MGWFIALAFLFAFGACAGSFLNVVIYRLPAGMSVVSPPSRCPQCSARLRWFDNLPILSWLFLRGRCRRCSAKIAVQYPLIEFVSGAMVAGLAALLYLVAPGSFWSMVGGDWWLLQGFSGSWPAFLCWSFALLGLFAMFMIDARTFLIPIQIPVFVTIVCWLLWPLQSFFATASTIVDEWPIPQLGWPATMASFGGLGGVLIGIGLLRSGLLRYSFDDYEAYVEEGETLADYPHARREMLVEIVFLLPCMIGIAMGWLLGVNLGSASGMPSGPWMALGASIGGWLVGGGIVWVVRILGTLAFGREAMGMGDVHLLACIGAAFGWIDPLLAFFIAPFSGLMWILVRAVGGRVLGGLSRELPYGPHLAIAVAIMVFLRPVILEIGHVLFPGLMNMGGGPLA